MRSIDEIYKNIAQSIVNNLPSNTWRKAWLNVESVDGSTGLDGEYLEAESTEIKYFLADDSAFDDFEELHSITTENGSNKWNRAKFTLTPSGEFYIDFEWDQELLDEIEGLNK